MLLVYLSVVGGASFNPLDLKHLYTDNRHQRVDLRNGRIDFASQSATLSHSRFSPLEYVGRFFGSESPVNITWLVSLKTPITDVSRQVVNDYLLPQKLGQYLPYNSFVVVGPSTKEFEKKLRGAPYVVFVGKYEAHHRTGSTIATQTLLVHLFEEFSRDIRSSTEFADSWTVALDRMNMTVSIKPLAPTLLEIQLPNVDDYDKVTAFLSHNQPVHWIEAKQKFFSQNKWARHVIQTDSNSTSIWDKGLRGEGHIVAVADTGLDHDSCFFRDPNHPVPIGRGAINFDHRKIVGYVPIADDFDEVAGHGTHVAGSLVGEAIDAGSDTVALSEFNGMAFKSKIIFYDIKRPLTEDLEVPGTLYNDIYKDAYTRGNSRIMSHSWGSEGGDYSIFAAETDRFAYDFPDALVVFAAGNYGEKGHFSLSTPGISKNVLTVGATKSSATSFFELGEETGFDITSPNELRGAYPCTPAAFGPKLASLDPFSSVVIAADPIEACGPLRNAQEVSGKIVIVRRGTCFFTDKAQYALQAGASALLVVQDSVAPPIVMGGDQSPTTNIPSAMISRAIGERILTSQKIVAITLPTTFASPDLNEGSMASFSSRGPTVDNRLKPDICAPGLSIVSVKSDGNPKSMSCSLAESLIPMQGTSMATPIAAGAAVLARQYFVDGWYPQGIKNGSNSLTPSGALVKAVLIASGVPVSGFLETDGKETLEEVRSPPSHLQGFGRLELDNVLYFSGESNFQLYVVDSQPISSLEIHSYCFRVWPNTARSSSPWTSRYHAVPSSLRATLVWTDPAASPGAAFVLINDLDIFASDNETGRVWPGNGQRFDDSDGEHFNFDMANNVEQVTLDAVDIGPSPRFISVHVRGTNVASGKQKYALVFTGSFENVDKTMCGNQLFCLNECHASEGWGTCDQALGFCKCAAGRAGSDCSEVSKLLGSEMVSDGVPSEGWRFYHFNVDEKLLTKGLELVLRRTSVLGDPDLYVRYDAYPDLRKHDYRSTVCDSCGQHTVITIQNADLRPGVYYVGVYGYCCDNSTYTLSVGVPSPTNKLFVVAIVVSSLVGLALLGRIVYAIATRNRRSRPARPAVDVSLEGGIQRPPGGGGPGTYARLPRA